MACLIAGRKTYPRTPLSTTNPTWTYLGLNPGVRGERSATSRLSRGISELLFRDVAYSLICGDMGA
jgi:glycerol-3-phosphate dehydrogenase